MLAREGAKASSEQGWEQDPTLSLLHQSRRLELWKALWIFQICFLQGGGGGLCLAWGWRLGLAPLAAPLPWWPTWPRDED